MLEKLAHLLTHFIAVGTQQVMYYVDDHAPTFLLEPLAQVEQHTHGLDGRLQLLT